MKIYKSLFSTAIAFLLAVESTLSVSAETVCYQNNSNNLFEVATCIQNNQATKKSAIMIVGQSTGSIIPH